MKTPNDDTLSWLVTACAGWYALWTGFFLSRRVPAFRQLFSGLGVALPAPTRLAILLCTPPLLWSVTAAAVIFLIVKEVRCKSVRTRVILSTIVFMATACASALITEAIFQPMLTLTEKIG
jgi:hypothetical protein